MPRLTTADRDALTKALQSARRGDSRAAQALYRRLEGLSAEEVLAALGEASAEFAKEIEKELREQILVAQRIGTRVITGRLLQTLRRRGLPEGLARRAERWLERRIADASYRVSPLTGLRTAAVSQEGTVWLSRALHGANSDRIMRALGQAIKDAVRHGETASSLAQRLRDEVGHRIAVVEGGPAAANIPPQLAEMEKAALRAIRASGNPEVGADLARTRRAFADYRDTLQVGGTRAAANAALSELEAAVARGSEKAVADAVKWYGWNRAAEHELTIAKTETARAYTQAYIEGSRAVPWVKGWTFVASPDACADVCAPLDGTFIPRDAQGPFPISDTHPRCECSVIEAIDEDAMPTEAEWEQTLAAAEA